MNQVLTVTLPIEITLEKISSLLSAALEGGTGYWATIGDYVKPSYIWHGKGEADTFPHIDYPLSDGGAITVWEKLVDLSDDFDGDDETDNMPAHRLDLAALRRGLVAMATEEPEHFADAMSEYCGDADTGDVFLQCCLFGRVVYA